MDSQELIDRLVNYLNSQNPQVVFDVDLEIEAGERSLVDLESNPRIKTSTSSLWPGDLAERLPESFSYLVRSYSFPCITLGPLLLFANTGSATQRELSQLLVSQEGWAPLLRNAGFLEIGKPEDGSFDAVCFDARRRCKGREFPIVRLYHEVLLDGRLPRTRQIAESFQTLAKSVIGVV